MRRPLIRLDCTNIGSRNRKTYKKVKCNLLYLKLGLIASHVTNYCMAACLFHGFLRRNIRCCPICALTFERCMGGSGIRSVVGAVVGLCSRWEAGNLRQRACGAIGLEDCTVGMWEFYTDPESPAPFFVIFTGIWRPGDIR
jgi:hypothetical protein